MFPYIIDYLLWFKKLCFLVININQFSFSLQKMAKWSSQHNGKFPDPYSKIKLDEEKKVKKKKKKKDKDRESILNQIDPNTNKVNIFL